MAGTGPAAELRQLTRFRKLAETQFLSAHLSSTTLAPPSEAEELAVAAFVVLLHGAFENFVEGLCLYLLNRAEHSWTFKKRLSAASATMLLSLDPPAPVISLPIVYDRIRRALSEAKVQHSRIIARNHGIAPADLSSLLEPVGLVLTTDAVKISSLELIVSLRHQWAHQYRFAAKKTKSATDIITAADDCIAIAQELASSATALRA